MVNDVAGLMLKLIKSEICGLPFAWEEAADIRDEDFEKLYKISKANDLAHIVGHALERNNIMPADSRTAGKFKNQILLAVYRYENINTELEKLKSAFEDSQIPFIPLKGSVIRQYYPEPWMRTSCDIDVLVHEEDLDKAVDYLEERLSYKTDRVRDYHDVSLFSPGGVHLELHFNVLEKTENLDKILSKIWDYALPKAKDSFEYAVTNEFLIYHLTAHMSYHFVGGGCGVRPFIDLFICKNKMQYDEKKVQELCSLSSIDIFYKAVQKTYSVWFNGVKSDELTEQITNYVVFGGVYGTSKNKAAVGTHKKGGKFRYMISRIFLPYADLSTYYPKLQNRRYLLPYYEVCRWFRIILKGRFKTSLDELRTIKNTSEEDSRQASELIERLGL